MKLLLVIVAALLAGSSAHAAGWDCSYAGFGDATVKVHARYRIEGHQLRVVGTGDVPYAVLENGPVALVAASGGAAFAPEAGAMIGTSTLIIKKDSGALVLGNVRWTPQGARSETTTGVCRAAKG